MARVKVDRLRADTTLQPVAAPAGSSYVVPEQQPVNQRSRARAEKLEQAFAQGQRMVGQYMAQQRAVENEKKSAEALYQVKSNLIRLEKDFGNEASGYTDPDKLTSFWDEKFNAAFPELVAENADPFMRDAVDSVFNQFKLEQSSKAADRFKAVQIEEATSDFAVSLSEDIDKAVADGQSQEQINLLIEDHISLMFEGNTLGLDRTDINAIVMEIGKDDTPRWKPIWGWVQHRDLDGTKVSKYESALDAMRPRQLKDDQTEFAYQFDAQLQPLVAEGRVKALQEMVEEFKPLFEQKGLNVYEFFDGYIKSAQTARAKKITAQATSVMLEAEVARTILRRQEATANVTNDELGVDISPTDINKAVIKELKTPKEGEAVDKFGYPQKYWANISYFKDPDLANEAQKVFNSFGLWGTMDNATELDSGVSVQRYQVDAISFMDKMDKIAETYGENVVAFQIGNDNYEKYRDFKLAQEAGASASEAAFAIANPSPITMQAPDFTSLASEAVDGDGWAIFSIFGLDKDAENVEYVEGRLKQLYNSMSPTLLSQVGEEGLKELVIQRFKESHKIMTTGDRTIAFPINDVTLLNKFGHNQYTPEIQENFSIALTEAAEDFKKVNDLDDAEVWIIPHPTRPHSFVYMSNDLRYVSEGSRTLTYDRFRRYYYDKVARDGSR